MPEKSKEFDDDGELILMVTSWNHNFTSCRGKWVAWVVNIYIAINLRYLNTRVM